MRLHTVTVLGSYAVVEVSSGGKATHAYGPIFLNRIDALVFRCWIERWRETYFLDPPVDVQQDCADALQGFTPEGFGLDDLVAPSDILNAFLASEVGRVALERRVA